LPFADCPVISWCLNKLKLHAINRQLSLLFYFSKESSFAMTYHSSK
jgi:hypothetical protein